MSNIYKQKFKLLREKKIASLYAFIVKYISIHGYAPLYSEMASALMCSTSTIKPILEILYERNLIESDHQGSPRAIRIGRCLNG